MIVDTFISSIGGQPSTININININIIAGEWKDLLIIINKVITLLFEKCLIMRYIIKNMKWLLTINTCNFLK